MWFAKAMRRMALADADSCAACAGWVGVPACRWYADRKEVKEWQEETRQLARNKGRIGGSEESRTARGSRAEVLTMLGRARPRPDIK